MHVDCRSTHDAIALESAICWCQDGWQHGFKQIFYRNQRTQVRVLRHRWKLLLRMDGTQQIDNVVVSSQKMMVLQPINAKFAPSSRGIRRQRNNICLDRDMTYNVQMIGVDAPTCSNLSSNEYCAVFETRMVSSQESTQTPLLGVICSLATHTLL